MVVVAMVMMVSVVMIRTIGGEGAHAGGGE